jgi:hypothetical protein
MRQLVAERKAVRYEHAKQWNAVESPFSLSIPNFIDYVCTRLLDIWQDVFTAPFLSLLFHMPPADLRA